MARGRVAGHAAALVKNPDLPRRGLPDDDAGVVVVARALEHADREEDGRISGQIRRPAVRALAACRVGSRQDLGLAAPRGDSHQARREIRGVDDRVVGEPDAAAVVRGVGDDRRDAAVRRDLLQLAVREEADPLSVGREERRRRALRCPRPVSARSDRGSARRADAVRRGPRRRRAAFRPGTGPGPACRRRGSAPPPTGSPRSSSGATPPRPAGAAAPATSRQPRRRRAGRRRSPGPRCRVRGASVEGGIAGSKASSISRRASAMSWNRVFASRSRHRRSTRRTEDGVSGGSAVQSTSARRTAASMSETVSPSKALRPVSIS